MNTGLILPLIFLATALGALAFSVAKLIAFASVSPEKKHLTEPEMLELRKKQMPKYAEVFAGSCAALEKTPSEKVEIISRDGLKLRGEYFANPEGRGTVLMFHGFRSSPHADMAPIFGFYYSLGFSLLLPCQRAHCASEGRYITYSVKERYDCADWAKYINERFGSDLPMVLDGVSMGASTVLASVSAGLPENVRCIVADCGFTSPAGIFKYVIKAYMHLPKFPLYYLFTAACKVFCGFSAKDYNTEEILKSCALPVLFVHGEDDPLVPCEMSRRNYEACASEKLLVTVPGAGHGESYLLDRERCEKARAEFIDRYVERPIE